MPEEERSRKFTPMYERTFILMDKEEIIEAAQQIADYEEALAELHLSFTEDLTKHKLAADIHTLIADSWQMFALSL